MNDGFHSPKRFKDRLKPVSTAISLHVQQHGLYLLYAVFIIAGYVAAIELTYHRSMKRPGQISLHTPQATALSPRAWVFEMESFVVVGKNGQMPNQPYMYRTSDSHGVINSGLVMTLKNKAGEKFYLEYHSDLNDEISIGGKKFNLGDENLFLVDLSAKFPEQTIRHVRQFAFPTKNHFTQRSELNWLSVPEISRFIGAE